jgi:hypothetical protein
MHRLTLATDGPDAGTIANSGRRPEEISVSDPVYSSVRMLENAPKNCQFVPLSRAFGAACRRDGSPGKALRHDEIGHERCWDGPSQVLMV